MTRIQADEEGGEGVSRIVIGVNRFLNALPIFLS